MGPLTWSSARWPFTMPATVRPLSALCTAATDAGFLIEKVIEPVPAETMRERYPDDYEKLSSEPGFLILRLFKPASPAPSRHLDPQPLPGPRCHRAPADGPESRQSEDGNVGVELPQRLQPRVSAEDDPHRADQAVREARHRGRAGLHRRANRARGSTLSELRCADRL